jgi:hypothetical protein
LPTTSARPSWLDIGTSGSVTIGPSTVRYRYL